MKLVIFTPAVKASAIGRVACLVTHSLVLSGHEVVIVRTESGSLLKLPTHDFGVSMIRWDDEERVTEALGKADSVSYHIGDNFPFHEGCIEWLPRHSGIVCLHDFFLGHLFYSWAENRRDLADGVLKRWYGEEGAKAFFATHENPDFISRTKDVAPMTEWICALATGVITHSHWGMPRVSRSCQGPVEVVPLAYDAGNIAMNGPVERRRADSFRLLTIGHINPNKRVANVLRALGGSAVLRSRCVYRLVGHVDPAAVVELSSLASRLRVNLVISGEADDRALASAFSDADVVSCLRWPSLEAASASAIESMLNGKATIVTNTGFYEEIPDDCVEKIPQEHEIDALRDTLEKLHTDPDRRKRLGENARRWAARTYTSSHYATELVRISERCAQGHAAKGARRFFDGMLQGWGATSNVMGAQDVAGSLNDFPLGNAPKTL